MLQSSSATELMGDFGVICFDTLYAQTHLHSNFITRTLSANSNSGLRNSYGVYEEFYFENAERMCGCVSDAGTDMLYTGAEVRRADGGEIYIRMNDGTQTKLDSPANVRTDAKANDNNNYYKSYNRMYFNFYDSPAADGQFGGSITFAGRGFGTVIAPEAAVNLGHNWDGCVVSEVFSNGGEFHRVPGNNFPDEEPTTIEIGHRAGLQLGRVQEIVRPGRH